MGDFVFRLRGVGGHGCNREAQPGEVFEGCGRRDCIDCHLQSFVYEFRLRFGSGAVEEATLTHWPVELNAIGRSYDKAHEVKDSLLVINKDGYVSPRSSKRIHGAFAPPKPERQDIAYPVADESKTGPYIKINVDAKAPLPTPEAAAEAVRLALRSLELQRNRSTP